MKENEILVCILLLTLLSVGGIGLLTDQILEEYRIYDKDSVAEVEWRKKTQHNLNRPREKKINL